MKKKHSTVNNVDKGLAAAYERRGWYVGQMVRIWCRGSLKGETVSVIGSDGKYHDGKPYLLADVAVVTRITTSGIVVKSLPPDALLPDGYKERISDGTADPLNELCLSGISEVRFGPTGHRIRSSHDGEPMDISTWIEAIRPKTVGTAQGFLRWSADRPLSFS